MNPFKVITDEDFCRFTICCLCALLFFIPHLLHSCFCVSVLVPSRFPFVSLPGTFSRGYSDCYNKSGQGPPRIYSVLRPVCLEVFQGLVLDALQLK